MKSRSLIIIVLLFGLHVFSQKDVKANDIDYSLKFLVIQSARFPMSENYFKTLDSIVKNNNKLFVRKLNSSGFSHFDFYNISDSSIPEQRRSFIIGLNKNNNVLYRLKGFLNNDFYYLLKAELREQENIPSNFLNEASLKKFKRAHSVEGLDLDCLVDNYNKKETYKIPCLSPEQQLLIDDFGEEHY